MATFVKAAAPVLADGLKVGDLWLQIADPMLLKVCIQVDPNVQFVTVGREAAAAIADEATAVPAGGTGAAAGAWDTAANRNTAITTMNSVRTKLNSVLATLRNQGIIRS